MDELDTIFAQINKYPLTVKSGTRIQGRSLRGKNELPLISQSVANAIATVAWGLSSPKGQSTIQKTLETSVNRKFFPYLNGMARGNRKSLHHIYEWEKVGQTSARLFDLKIPAASRGKASFSMRVEFRPSKSLVPLTAAQADPGPSGAVVSKRYVFYNKAMVMEYGQRVTIRPLGDNFMAFDTPPGLRETATGLTFTKRPIQMNYAELPTYHGLEKVMTAFFQSMGAKNATESVGRYSRKVNQAAERASHMISVSTPSDAYARAVASKMTNSLAVLND